jgi:two-component system, LuxR family, sensor kinase FixL
MARVPEDKGFRWLFDAAVDAMLLADVDGRIAACNASCGKLFGYAAEEWTGLSIEALVPERFRAAHRHFRAGYAAAPMSRPMGRGSDLYGRRKDGSEFPAQISLSVLPEAEEPLILAIIEDITVRRSTEDALRQNARQLSEQDALLSLAVRATGLAPWEWSPWTARIKLSPEWKAQLGYPAEELAIPDAQWRERLHPDDIAPIEALVAEFAAGSRTEAEVKYRLRHRDGSYRWMQSRAVLLPASDERGKRLLGIQWDVTEQVERAGRIGEWHVEESRQRQFQVALETAAAIAHEVNQPLNAVLSFSEAAQLMGRQGRLDKLDYALTNAVAQASRAGHVVHDLLQFLERQDIPSKAIDLNRLVRETVDLVTAEEALECRINLSLAPDLPPVLGNEIQIRKVLLNLVRNGAEAMANAGMAGGPITVTVGTANEGGMAQVTVRDSGPGVDPATVERIFEPFFTTKPRGIGMGLATSRRMVERLGGRMWFEAGPGADAGATFHFTVPFAA